MCPGSISLETWQQNNEMDLNEMGQKLTLFPFVPFDLSAEQKQQIELHIFNILLSAAGVGQLTLSLLRESDLLIAQSPPVGAAWLYSGTHRKAERLKRENTRLAGKLNLRDK